MISEFLHLPGEIDGPGSFGPIRREASAGSAETPKGAHHIQAFGMPLGDADDEFDISASAASIIRGRAANWRRHKK